MAKTKHSTTTRRAILAGAAALPALSLPAIANDQDAELWRHADAIIRLWPEWERLFTTSNEAGWRMADLAKERAGFTPGMSGEERETRFRAALEIADRETGHSEWVDKFDLIEEPVQVHVKAIEKLPARSIIGLAAKAIAAGTAISQAWDGPLADTDWDDGRARLLIEATLTAAGVANPFAVAGKAVQS
jgi:hypothetical protein